MKLEKEVTVIPVSNTRIKKIAIDATFFTLQKYISVGSIERIILLKKCKKNLMIYSTISFLMVLVFLFKVTETR